MLQGYRDRKVVVVVVTAMRVVGAFTDVVAAGAVATGGGETTVGVGPLADGDGFRETSHGVHGPASLKPLAADGNQSALEAATYVSQGVAGSQGSGEAGEGEVRAEEEAEMLTITPPQFSGCKIPILETMSLVSKWQAATRTESTARFSRSAWIRLLSRPRTSRLARWLAASLPPSSAAAARARRISAS